MQRDDVDATRQAPDDERCWCREDGWRQRDRRQHDNQPGQGEDDKCWVRRRYCLAGITKLGEQVAKNTKLE